MSKQPSNSGQQRQQHNHRSDALNNNRGTSGTNPTNAHPTSARIALPRSSLAGGIKDFR